MRALGAHVTLYSDTQTAIRALEDNADPLAAVAIDMLAAGIAVNTLSRTGNVRPSGIIQDTLTYGYLLQPGVQNWTQTVSFKGTDMSLIQCLELNVRIGTGELNAEVHFRKYETMAFDENEDLADRNAQNKQFSQSQVLSSTLLPLFAILVLILAFLLDRFYLTNGQQYEDMHLSDSEEPHGGERPNGKQSFTLSVSLNLPHTAALLSPMLNLSLSAQLSCRYDHCRKAGFPQGRRG